MAFCTVEGIDNNEKEDDETTKPARDDVGGDDEADPGDNDKEIEWEIYLIEDCGKLSFHFNNKSTSCKLSILIGYDTIVYIKISYFNIELEDYFLSFLVVVVDGVAGHLVQLVVVASDQEVEGMMIEREHLEIHWT